ncbi:hypothetical protein DUNSADRAFT_17981 [Dunaliella salina]|uniref:Uncharacterized protein n=1 Tax=Dunaliella salina TaxID=3046 RepID=A0ABQ7GZM3_DUNSA|nr:hypothetical protein DUNSADRAFT_17981 [Dunaliella salina]|eukprot:KAF5840064.1 hypothetical protein DUNSADRAFT_17981 [Dunaliella salina]
MQPSGKAGALAERYLNSDDLSCPSRGSTFGKPFRFGMALPLTFNRSPPDYIAGPQWHCLDYLDPARAWRQKAPQQQPPTVRASIINHQRSVGQEQVPPPAAVTISKVPALAESGLHLNRIAGTAVREYGAVVPLGLDGSFMIYERLEPPDVRRKLAAAKEHARHQALHGRSGAAHGMGALERVMQAWTEEEQAERCTPGPASYNVDGTCSSDPYSFPGGRPISTLGGPSYTMGARTKPVGQTLQEREAALAPGPGQYEVSGSVPSGPAFTIKGKPREHAPESAFIPGPGAYHAELPGVGTGPAYTISGRTKDVIDEHIPGPGDYNIARSTNEGPAHTIAPRAKPPPIEVLPGPADYQRVETARTGPAYTIAARPDPKLPGSDLPAPGEYELPEAWKEGPAFSIAPRTQKEGPRDISPGPGQYSQPKSPDGPAYTIAGRPFQPEPPESPGPTDYQQTVLPPSGPAYTMAGRERPSTYAKEEEAMLPGPGQYTIPDSPSAPAYTMASRTAVPDAAPDSPGPAAYGLPPDPRLPSAPAYTMAPRMPLPDSAPDSPGPAQYQDAGFKPGGPAYTLAGRPTEKEDASDHPAPGDYDVDGAASRGPAYSIPQAGASGAAKPEGPASPGPGEYEVPLPPQGPAYTIATTGRPQPKPGDGGPGPGDYSDGIDALGNRGPAYTIAGRPEVKPPKDILPGPGEYEAPPSPSGPAYTIAPRIEPPSDKHEPVVGPGYYDPQQPSSAPAYTIAPRYPLPRDKSQDGMPGPGEYGEMPSPRGPAYTMAGPFAPAQDPVQGGDSPGPWAYSVPEPGPGGPAYTMAGRPKEPKASKEASGPGPGEYGGIESQPDGPAYTMQGRYRAPEPPSTPGPGDYAQPLKPPEGPAFTIAPKLPTGKGPDQDIPAPGAYGSPGQDLIGQSGPAYTMAGRKPAPLPSAGADSPGPGEYGAGPSSPSGPAWTLGARTTSAIPQSPGRDSPGPGTYAPALAPDGPAFTLGARVNVPSPNADNPAPGDYGVPGPRDYTDPLVHAPTGPAFTLRPKHVDPRPDMKPGPGQYDFSHFTNMPPTSSILQTRPQGRTEYLVSQFTFGGEGFPSGLSGGAAAYAPRGGAPTSRPAVRRKVNFTEDTRFRDSTEGGGSGRGTYGPGPSTMLPKPPQAAQRSGRGSGGGSGMPRPASAPQASRPSASRPAGGSLLASLYGYGAQDAHGPAPEAARGAERGRQGGGAKGGGEGGPSGRGVGSMGGVRDGGARPGSAPRTRMLLKQGLGGKHVAYPAAAAAAAAASEAGAAARELQGTGDAGGLRSRDGGGGGPGLLARYTTQPASTTYTFSPPRRPRGEGGSSYEGFLGASQPQPQPLPQHQQRQAAQLDPAQPLPGYLSGVIEAQQQLNRQFNGFGAATAAARANAQNLAPLSGAAGAPVVGIGRQSQSGAGIIEQQGGRQARQPPLASVLRTEAAASPSVSEGVSTSIQPSLRGPSIPPQQQQQAGGFSFGQHADQQHGASGDSFAFDVGQQRGDSANSFAFDVGQQPQTRPQHTATPPQQQPQHGGQAGGGLQHQQQQPPRGGPAGGSLMARARERMASHASGSPGS